MNLSLPYQPTRAFRPLLALLIGIPLALGTGSGTVRAAEEALVTADASGYVNRPIAVAFEITGTDNEELELNFFVPAGSLSFGTTTGVSIASTTDPSSVQMAGTREALNAVLATMTYERGATGSATIDAWLSVGGGDFAYNEETKHVYQVVTPDEPVTWAEAHDLAAGLLFDEVIPGYLATITSLQEHNFVLARIQQDGWIGGSDSVDEGVWRWMTGPEAESDTEGHFWTGTATGTTTEGMFANWATGEPNNDTGEGTRPAGEDCAEIRFTGGAGGKWNDLDCAQERPNFVVEFGAGENVPAVIATSFTITVTAVPAGVLALEKIQEYARTNGESDAPTVENYEDAGIEGVTEENLGTVNEMIAGMDPAPANGAAVEAAATQAIAYHVIETYANSNGATTAPTLETYQDAGIAGVTEGNLNQVNEALRENGSVASPAQLESLIAEAVQDAARSESPRRSGGSSVQSRAAALAASGSTARAAELRAEYAHLFSDGPLASLYAQLAELQARLAALTTTAAAPVARDLTIGDEGEDVRALQTWLIAEGYAIHAGATGYFGAQTRDALAAYQAANGISPAAGYFGALTRAHKEAAASGS